MKKFFAQKFLLLSLVLILGSSAFAAKFHSVPLDNPSYRLIEVAQARGVIPLQSDVKPYSLSAVRSLLSAIAASGSATMSEKQEIERILADFDRRYGIDASKGFDQFVKNGFIRFVDSASGEAANEAANKDANEAANRASANPSSQATSVMAGAYIASRQVVGMNMGKDRFLDSRNSITAYVRGDLFGYASYDMNFGLLLDRLDPGAFLMNDFTLDCEGFYMDLMNGGDRPDSIPDGHLYTGLAMAPELSASLMGGRLDMRFASVKRDWGPGSNNLGLSGSARSFDAAEVSIRPVQWFGYSVMTGALGKFPLEFADGTPWLGDELHENLYDNNFSMHRLEFSLAGFKAAIYESCVWRKRFELAYLNPLSIYMFAQNSLGDFDNMLAGLDFSYVIKGFGKLYGALAIDEMNSKNPKRFISHARNIIALQGGIAVPVGMGDFGCLRFQATYIPPFFGSHYDYPYFENPWGSGDFGTSYVNKGQPLSYPLAPDSMELMLSFSAGLGKGWGIEVLLKDQMHSAQYATDSNGSQHGTTIMDTIDYDISDGYADKEFFSYIWKNTVDAEIRVSKSLEGFPLEMSAGLQCIVDTSRSYSLSGLSTELVKKPDGTTYKTIQHNLGKSTTMGNVWNTDVRFICTMGVKLYY